MATIIDPRLFARLAEIAAATGASGAAYSLNDNILAALISAGYVQTNPAMVQNDLNGNVVSIAARATDSGMLIWRNNNQATEVAPQLWQQPVVQPEAAPIAKAKAEKPVFEVEAYDAIPEIARGVGAHLKPKEAIYPWAHVMPGQRFFIAEQISERGDNKGQPVRHYSAATSANARIREEYNAALQHNAANPFDMKPLPVAKQFVCLKVKAGEHGAKCNGEFMYCKDGLAPEPKPRAKNTAVVAQ